MGVLGAVVMQRLARIGYRNLLLFSHGKNAILYFEPSKVCFIPLNLQRDVDGDGSKLLTPYFGRDEHP